MKYFHAVMTVLWALLIVPTMLWWRESLPWIALMSVYAIVISHWGAWQARRAQAAVDDLTDTDS